MLKILSLLLWSYTTLVVAAATDCTITLPSDIQGYAPVILTNSNDGTNYELFKPTGEVTTLTNGTQLLLACTGSKNTIESLSVDTLNLQCVSGSFVDSNNTAYLLSELVCDSIPSPTLDLTSDLCSNGNGYLYKSGFTIDDQFYGPVFEICYSNVTENTFYTHNTINGAAIDYAVQESTRRSFSAVGMQFTTTKTNTYYTQTNQKARMVTYFGENQTYIDSSNYLARGHLSPDGDFIFGYEQLATYYYANVAPEFQPINAGNWLRVEELARSAAALYGDDIEAYNGYMDILQLSDDNGDLIDIYLDDTELIEPPKYYYKVLVHEASDSAIVFVTVNNPYITDGPAEEICTNVCEESGLYHENFPTLSKGYTFCCTLDEFKLLVDSLPDEVQGSNLLTSNSDTEDEEDVEDEEVVEASNDCTITLPSDIQGYAPVILTNSNDGTNYELFKPTGEVTTLTNGTQLLLACTGSKNTIESLSVDTLNLQCVSGSFVDSNNTAYLLSELVCDSIPSPTLDLTSDLCSNGNGYLYKSGFTIDDQFYGPVFEICYSNVTENTFYTHNTINGATIDYAVQESTRRSFSAVGMQFTTTKTNTYYTQTNQKARMVTYFGENQTYIDSSNYLARGHLSPDGDFIFGYEQLATYYYANVAPEFQPINAGNWLRVEELARSAAALYGDDIEAYNGYMDILQLSDDNGDLIDIYLDDTELIEPPKYYYKVLVHEASDSAIVFVTVNNPYITDGPAEEICTNVCEESGLYHENFPTLSKGYTFCCTLDEFKLLVDSLPDEVQGSNLLTNVVTS